MKLAPALAREGHLGQHIDFADIHQIGELVPSRAELICDPLPCFACMLAVWLIEGLPDGGPNDRVLAL